MTARLTALLLAVIAAGPAFAACGHGATTAEVSCAPGTTWDAERGTCVTDLTG